GGGFFSDQWSANLSTGLPTWGNHRAWAGFSTFHPAPVVAAAPPAAVAPVAAPAAPVAAPVAPVAAPVVAPVAEPQVPVYILPPNFPLASAAPAAAATPPPDAFVNLGVGPYPEAALITSGGAQPWYNSTQISGFFGGTPTTQQQSDFAKAVMQHVEQTFSASGVAVTLSDTPGVTAPHTLSLVSNTVPTALPTAVGMTDVGANGFSFIDQEAKSAANLDQLAWIVAHNISHELMLAFGVGENYDTTGNYVDARNANLAMMIDPSSTFSPAAAAALNQAIAAEEAAGTTAAQVLGAQTVPEPGTAAVWVVALLGFEAVRCRAKVRDGR
ncbi:MAG TPA: hypothetical protein VG406_08390, partial [Isosphaeraceae bacterium]|nr:hypothetical protein [Isosphaeraceae bacterium]